MATNKQLVFARRVAGIMVLAGGAMLPVLAEENNASLNENEDQMVVTASGFSQQKKESLSLLILQVMSNIQEIWQRVLQQLMLQLS